MAPTPTIGATLGALLLSSHLFIPCQAHGTGHRTGHGLIGFGIPMYEPHCAFACRDVIATSRLACSSEEVYHDKRHGGHGHDAPFETSADCFAGDEAFLGSLAWCLHTRCEHEEAATLEGFWHANAAGSGAHQPSPEYGYQESLDRIAKPPKQTVEHDEVLDSVRLVPEEDWQMQYGKLRAAAQNEMQHTRHGIALVASAIFIPLLSTLLAFLARSTALEASILSRFVYPALVGKRHLVPLPYDAGLLPNRGQSIYIAILLLLNLLLASTGYTFSVPGTPYARDSIGKAEVVANRLGILIMANLLLIFLYSSRNNPLIRLTSWTHGSFLLYHRWVAYISILQAAIHGAIYIVAHIGVLQRKFTQGYWNAGSLALLVFLVTIPASSLPVRRRFYEAFLDIHIASAVIALVGIYYHLVWHFGHAWGYENWLYLAVVVWGVERTVRLIKTASNGLRTATVSVVDDEYLMLTVPDAQATGHAFLYFPTLGWRFWENHPFSISSSIQEVADLDFEDPSPDPSAFELVGSDSDTDDDEKQIPEKRPESLPLTPLTPHSGVALLADAERDDDGDRCATPKPGLTFFIRRGAGMTSRLGAMPRTLPVLVEASYRSAGLERAASCANLVCIVGGSGITSVMPLLRARAGLGPARTCVYWACRSAGLARRVGVEGLGGSAVEVRVRVGERWDVGEVVRREAAGSRGEVVVVVSGPAGMADDARRGVVEANRSRRRRGEGGVVRLVEECFSW